MYKNCTIAAVVPAFNEEKLIGRVIETMPGFVDRIVVVDDCSEDRTGEIVEKLAATDAGRVVLLRHESNQGVGAAIASGYKWALANDVAVAVVMAGDAQMDPADLPALLDPIVEGRVDYAKGDRLTAGKSFDAIPKVRFFGNSILSLLTKIASGYWHVVDSQTGYTAINRRALHQIDWDRMYKRFGQPNHLLVMLNVHNFRVCDVPITPVYNIGEKSGIRVHRAVFSISWLLLKSFLWRMKEKYIIRDFHPLIFFYLLGALTFIAAGFFFVRLIYNWAESGDVPDMTFLAWMFSSVISLQSTFFAMWFDMEHNRHLRGDTPAGRVVSPRVGNHQDDGR